MKKRCLLSWMPWAGLLLLASCRPDEGRFVLRGQLEGLQHDTLLVFNEYAPDGVVDTVVARDGRFEFATRVDTITPFTLLADGVRRYSVYAERGLTAMLTADVRIPSQWAVAGGAHNETLTADRLRLDAESRPDRQANLADSCIRSHPGSYANLYLIETYFVRQDSIDYRRLKRLVEGMNGDVQDALYTRRFHETVKRRASGRLDYVPGFSWKDGGQTLTPATFRDRVYVIHFWMSDDSASARSLAQLKRVYRRYKTNKAFDMLGVSFDVDVSSWAARVKADTLAWRQVVDPEGFCSKHVQSFRVTGIPACFLIDAKRRVRAVNPSEESLTALLDEALKEAKTLAAQTKKKK